MIYLTGDIHANININKLNSRNFPEQKYLTKNDYLIICGDFGIIQNNSKTKHYWLNWLSEKKFTTLFLDGNHENFDLLNQYPCIEKFGGKVHIINDSIYHLIRGEVYTIDEKSFFVMGGAETQDTNKIITLEEYNKNKKKYTWITNDYEYVRVIGMNYWEQELPNKNELDNGMKNLKLSNYQVDYILTHCASNTIEDKIMKISDKKMKSPRLSNGIHICDYFDNIENSVTFKHWYFGHYHQDIDIDDKHTCLFNTIKQLK